MTKSMLTFVSLLCFILSVPMAVAGDHSLKGRSSIELNIGFWHESKVGNEISRTGILSTARSSGFIGGLSFSYWLQEELSLSASIGLLSGEATSSVTLLGVSQRTSSVVPVLLGVRYYLPESSYGTPVRPFLAAAVGPILGVESKNDFFSQESRSETALGARLGGGIDFLLGQYFKLGTTVGYNLMTDFSSPVGARKNF
ncbi:MAG: hypothetical protein AABZ61_02770, partial [Bacteroidota bacterium]